MNCETMVKLPVIDFSNQDLKPGTLEWDLVKAQVRQAIHEYSCFEASFDKILEVRKPLFGAMEELFDLPFQTKQLCVPDKLFRGYNRLSSRLHESILIDDANVAENIEQRLTKIFWPQGNSNFSQTLFSFSELASGLEKKIRRMILESFGVEKYADELIDSTNYMLRLMKYKGQQPQSNEPSLRAHYDQNMVTLLYQNEVNGLEIQTKHGEWINVKPSPDSFIVMTSESLSVWLNGRLRSPKHRVMVTENKARYCAGLFATPKGGYQVKIPEELVDEQNPLMFKPFDYEEFLDYFSSQLAKGDLSAGLKAYCSI
ncbi:Oxoglutarate/iron-dependent dioxygenase [Corchorus olitorius]|uniref:Oxoglutarate/iron-dependent dioxygenase n=1 Tax=Corchorus olitorius TaxID=93759 RepID=A0A1R3JZF0_9ROSI|nr:Oxoglutarate/iron-dependent dioxygenase [Corchorus olitorius]